MEEALQKYVAPVCVFAAKSVRQVVNNNDQSVAEQNAEML